MEKKCKVLVRKVVDCVATGNVKIGKSTARLIECKRALSKLYEEVDDICYSRDGANVREDVMKNFDQSFINLNESLVEIIGDVIDYVSVSTDYREI